MKATVRFFALVATIVVITVGCGADTEPGWRLDRPRVLGARVDVASDPSRAWPAPGEAFDLDMFVVDPDDTAPRTSWSLVACRPAAAQGTLEACDGAPYATLTGAGDSPRVAMTMPDEEVLDGDVEILVRGVVCTGDAAAARPDDGYGHCEGDARDETTVSLHVGAAGDEPANHHPEIDDVTVTFDGADWTPEDCPVVVADGDAHAIGLSVPESLREPVGQGSHEELRISHMVSAGELARQFSVVEADAAAGPAALEVEWTAPGAGDEDAAVETVLVVLVVRDLRGGTSWTRRELCLARGSEER